MNDEDERTDEAGSEEIQPETADDESQKEIESLTRQLKATTADFYNFRQRTIKERQETRKRAQEEVITSILPVLDNLDRALDAASSEDAKSILKGVEMVQRQFVGVLEGLGVTAIKSEGESFDPALHDASGTENVDDPELDGKIITERLKGYRTKERVLRPSQVTVGKYEA
ncbi:MAG: nucleotide exchange factor GrpE [Synergistaceae bacterium]|nr:nucleotide exchange factor GrpE [Synergistaceae bacterium]